MTWLDDESSVETSQPREGIEIVTPSVTYRIATGSRNVTIDGQTYTAQPASRDSVGVSFLGNPKEMTLSLPLSHAFAQRYLAGTSPPRIVQVTVWRKQVNSGEAERIHIGLVTSCAIERHVAKFRVPATSGEAFIRRLPNITTGRGCPHILYDANCRVSRSDFRVPTTVASFADNTVTVASIGGKPNDWATFGELVHVESGERMPIVDQVGTLITLQLPIFELGDGDAVEIYAGCSHIVTVCASKFDNVVNYGGEPQLPRGNIFLPGFGVWQSE